MQQLRRALERIERLDEIADGMEHLVTNFLTLARPATDEPQQLNPAALIREVIDFERLDLDRLGIHVDLDLQEDLRLFIDRGNLKSRWPASARFGTTVLPVQSARLTWR